MNDCYAQTIHPVSLFDLSSLLSDLHFVHLSDALSMNLGNWHMVPLILAVNRFVKALSTGT
jgi:hypothetical protein